VWLNPPPAAGGVMIALALAALDEAEMRDCPAGAMAAALAVADDARRAAGHDPQALLARLGPPAHRGTTHISVIDGDGMACALTITNGEGNGHVVEGCGFMLNNMLGEADVNPDGLEGWPEDVRLSSMMAPTLAGAEDGTLVALGSGGSNRIRSAVFMVLARLLAAGRELAAAIDAPRLHVEADFLDFEPGFAAQEVARLTAMFPRHRAWSAPNLYFGGCHAVARKADGALVAAADKRREGAESVI
ncbi:MAG TPA: Gamma-glutamyltranspeptidase, partial [Thermopetrobacter sp.]|nr:Gamma-glutamyltranspeptidase [Thermopetrobacter sp.]